MSPALAGGFLTTAPPVKPVTVLIAEEFVIVISFAQHTFLIAHYMSDSVLSAGDTNKLDDIFAY